MIEKKKTSEDEFSPFSPVLFSEPTGIVSNDFGSHAIYAALRQSGVTENSSLS